MLKLTNGSPRMGQNQLRRMALKTTNENPIDHAAGETRSERITRQFPIQAIDFAIVGEVDVSSALTLTEAAVYGLIRNITIARNGNDPVFSAKGEQLPYIDWIYRGKSPMEISPDTGTGTNKFRATFRVPFDLGGYNSLLDASGDKSLEVRVDWANDSGLFSAGSGTVQNTKLEILPRVITGAGQGEIGGKEGGDVKYLRQYILSQSQPVNADQDDFMFDLVSDRGYHGLTLFAYGDGVLDASIIQRVTLERADSRHIAMDAEEIAADNYTRFDLPSATAWGNAVLDLPFVEAGHPEHVQSIASNQAMKLILKVDNNAAKTQRIDLVQHYVRK